MTDQEFAASDPVSATDRVDRRGRFDGPFLLAALLSVAGIAFIFFGTVTIVPWISDEREPMSVRSIWLALSRNLPDLGPDSLVRAGFWVLLAAIASLAIALLLFVSRIDDDAIAGGD